MEATLSGLTTLITFGWAAARHNGVDMAAKNDLARTGYGSGHGSR